MDGKAEFYKIENLTNLYIHLNKKSKGIDLDATADIPEYYRGGCSSGGCCITFEKLSTPPKKIKLNVLKRGKRVSDPSVHLKSFFIYLK